MFVVQSRLYGREYATIVTVKKKKEEINLNKKRKFPRISLFIPESILRYLQSEKVLISAILLSIGLFCVMLFLIFQLLGSLRIQKQVLEERVKVVKDIAFWEQVVKEKPDYRDGYFSLALLQYRMGDKKKALENVAKVLELDPNFKAGREFEQMLK